MQQDTTKTDDVETPVAGRHPGHGRGPRGFVLVAVIWSLGLIIVLASFGIKGARFRQRATADAFAQAKAAAAADIGISLGIARALLQASDVGVVPPWRCTLPGGHHLAVAIADEVGKVDLNAAPLALLTSLFANLSQDRDAGAEIAADIVDFRAAARDQVEEASSRRYARGGKPEGPKHTPFVTTLELDQVVGVSHAVFEAALPFVTVRARRSDVDFFRATPAMRRLFGVHDVGATASGSQGVRDVTITADATTTDGARFVREALVSLSAAGASEPYIIREWRHADAGVPASREGDAAADGPCLAGLDRS